MTNVAVALFRPCFVLFFLNHNAFSLFLFSCSKIFQTSAPHPPAILGVRCAARTKRATSSATVLQAGPEPGVKQVMSSSAAGGEGSYVWNTVYHSMVTSIQYDLGACPHQ